MMKHSKINSDSLTLCNDHVIIVCAFTASDCCNQSDRIIKCKFLLRPKIYVQ